MPKLWRRELNAGHWQALARPERLAGWIREFVRALENRQQPPVSSPG
ncbi:hypothetical protein [Pseudomonas sp. 2FE]|nr:hypothetical protein [Pseudomonas sp. 2FE]